MNYLPYIADRVFIFFREALPEPRMVLWLAPPLLLYTLLCAALAAWLRTRRGWQTAYTRKTFHFLIFSAAGILQLTAGLSSVVLFGSIVSSVVLYAVWKGSGFPFYEALARPNDAPHRSLFVLIPLLTTALGGVVSNLLFPAYAYLGYLVVGWADAIGEPVGKRWGKHPYRVFSLAGVRAERSWEGSAAVFVTAVLVTAGGLASRFSLPAGKMISVALAIGLATTVTEAISNHGIDNFTLQLVAAGLAQALI